MNIVSLLGSLSLIFAFIPLFVSVVLLISNRRKSYGPEGKRILPSPSWLFRIQNILGYLIFLFLLPRFLLSSIAPILSFIGFVSNTPVAILESSDLLGVLSLMYAATVGAILTPLALLLFVVFFVSSIITGLSALRPKVPATDIRSRGNGVYIAMVVLSIMFIVIFFGTRFITSGKLENALAPKEGTVLVSGITGLPEELLQVEFLTQTVRGSTNQFNILTFKNDGSSMSLVEGPTVTQPQDVVWAAGRGISLEPGGALDFGKHNALVQKRDGKTMPVTEAHAGKSIHDYIISPQGGYVAYSEMEERKSASSPIYDPEEETYVLPLSNGQAPVALPFMRVVDFVSEHELIAHSKGEKNARGGYGIVEMLYDVRTGASSILPPQHQIMLGSRWADRSPTGALYYTEMYRPTDGSPSSYAAETRVISRIETLSPLTTKTVLVLPVKTMDYRIIGDSYYELIRKNESSPEEIAVELWRYDLLTPDTSGKLIFTFPKGMVPYGIMSK